MKIKQIAILGFFLSITASATDLERKVSFSASNLDILDAAKIVLSEASNGKKNEFELAFRPTNVDLVFYSESLKIAKFRVVFNDHLTKLCTDTKSNLALRDIPASKALQFLAEQADCEVKIEEKNITFTLRPQKRFIASIQTERPEELLKEGLNRLYEPDVDYYGPIRYNDSLSHLYHDGILHFIAEEWAFNTLVEADKELETKGANQSGDGQ